KLHRFHARPIALCESDVTTWKPPFQRLVREIAQDFKVRFVFILRPEHYWSALHSANVSLHRPAEPYIANRFLLPTHRF
ncbi:hypothetical protein K443DRAFT_117725, partial [Laccaria amethystina LaAM-08-1]